ncbi:GDSL-like lipase/acylhydrolase family protein [Pseudoduganella flava]|uniref:GDSL-like lipase/acylhydrolase family protein n=1 Tax=Pseudoduganella flava TaxID=871742 RepID=A0A562PMB3_9BURK|nr:hypothetical protein [Pseudoduganella flava]QGZ40973.1 hypothetical protein GO485_19125 [Pseudoduganella flava]TWI45340.1 GDSL-like lipase/acylhydrolase family protein [Pseudoduganella flava]
MVRFDIGKRFAACWRNAAAGVLGLALLLGAAHAAADTPGVFRIMPLGDSLTAGYPALHGVSYRLALRNLLTAAGIPIDYVGSQEQDPADPRNDLAHEGLVGITVDGIRGNASWRTYQPDIILLLAGTNDIRNANVARSLFELYRVVEEFKLAQLVDTINADYSRMGRSVQIFVSSLPPQGYPADGTWNSTLTRTMFDFLSGRLSDVPRPVEHDRFVNAYARFLAGQRLAPDLDRIFADADQDGVPGLSDEEADAAVRALATYIINKFIGDYNVKIRALASAYRNVHFVDAGATVTLADMTDGTHPASQEAYEKMAPAWFEVLSAWFAGQDRYWVGGSGLWSDAQHWSFTPGGAGGAAQPGGGNAVIVQDDALDRVVTRDAGASTALLAGVELDARGTGDLTLRLEQGLRAVEVLAGRTGRAHIQQEGAIATAQFLTLAQEEGSTADYRLDDGTLRTLNEDVGYRGAGAIVQNGGNNDVFSQLILAFGPGSGTYLLEAGEILANQEFIGLNGTGVFTQRGGLNQVQFRHYTAGDVSGTLFVGTSGEPGGRPAAGTYNMLGGALDALRIVNGGTFVYAGGEVAGKMSNDAVLRVSGYRRLAGDFVQSATGALHLDDALVSAQSAVLHIDGNADIDGAVYIHPGAQATLPVGAAFDVLSAATGIDNALLAHVVLPLLPDTRLLRASVIDGTLRIAVDTVRCEDVYTIRNAIGQRGTNLPADVNHDGVVDVRDVAAMAKKLPRGTLCRN